MANGAVHLARACRKEMGHPTYKEDHREEENRHKNDGENEDQRVEHDGGGERGSAKNVDTGAQGKM